MCGQRAEKATAESTAVAKRDLDGVTTAVPGSARAGYRGRMARRALSTLILLAAASSWGCVQRAVLLPVLFASIMLAGGCAQRKAPSSSPASIERHRAATGQASWYGKAHQGQHTASGELFDMHALTAAHRTLPFGTIVRVTDLRSGRSVNVRINDRGPFRRDRIIDLSYEAARKLGFVARGTARVEITVVD